LHWRLASEDDCWDLVQPHVILGFGRFVFGGVQLEGQRTKITADGMWLIALVANGLFGLTTLFAALILPPMAMARKLKPVHWRHPAVAPTAAVAVVVLLFAIDNLFNAMINPLFLLGAGGLVSTAASIPDYRRAVRPVAAQGSPPRMMQPRPASPQGPALQT
jgi:hypothetical protein